MNSVKIALAQQGLKYALKDAMNDSVKFAVKDSVKFALKFALNVNACHVSVPKLAINTNQEQNGQLSLLMLAMLMCQRWL